MVTMTHGVKFAFLIVTRLSVLFLYYMPPFRALICFFILPAFLFCSQTVLLRTTSWLCHFMFLYFTASGPLVSARIRGIMAWQSPSNTRWRSFAQPKVKLGPFDFEPTMIMSNLANTYTTTSRSDAYGIFPCTSLEHMVAGPNAFVFTIKAGDGRAAGWGSVAK